MDSDLIFQNILSLSQYNISASPIKRFRRYEDGTKEVIPYPYEHCRNEVCKPDKESFPTQTEGLLLITGYISNLLIIDIDSEEAANLLLSNLNKKHLGELSNYIIKTNQGYQLFYLYDQDIKSKTRLLSDIDVLSDNKQTFAHPINPGYSLFYGSDIQERTFLPSELKSFLLTHSKNLGVNKERKKFDTDLEILKFKETPISQYKDPLGFLVEEYLNIIKSPSFKGSFSNQFIIKLRNKLCKGEWEGSWGRWDELHIRHNYAVWLWTKLYTDSTVHPDYKTQFFLSFCYEILQYDEGNKVDRRKVESIMRWSIPDSEMSYDEEWEKFSPLSKKKKEDSRNNISHLFINQDIENALAFVDPKQGLYYYYDSSIKKSDYNPLAMSRTEFKEHIYKKTGVKVNFEDLPPISVTFDLSQQETIFWDESIKEYRFNMYEPSEYMKRIKEPLTYTPTLPESWSALFDSLSGGDKEVKEYLLNEIATILKMPQFGHTIDVFRGPGGTGKSTYFSMLKHLLGKDLCKVVSYEHFTSRFNEILQNTLALCIEEVPENNKEGESDFQRSMKTLIANETISIEGKGKPIKEIPNYLNIFIATNRQSSILSNNGIQRRDNEFDTATHQLVTYEPFRTEMERNYKSPKEVLLESIDEFVDYLNSLPFNLKLFRKQIITDSSRAFAEESKGGIHQLVSALENKDFNLFYSLIPNKYTMDECKRKLEKRKFSYILRADLNEWFGFEVARKIAKLLVRSPFLQNVEEYNPWEKGGKRRFYILDELVYRNGLEEVKEEDFKLGSVEIQKNKQKDKSDKESELVSHPNEGSLTNNGPPTL